MDLWERGQHAILVGDSEVEGAAQKGTDADGGSEEEDDAVARIYNNAVLSGKI